MLTVNDLMTVMPQIIQPDFTLRQVIEIMKTEGCRQLPVVNNKGELAGIITDRDIRLAMNSPLVLHGSQQDEALLNSVTAESCMTPNPLCVTPETPAAQAASMLNIYKFGGLPVTDDNILVGIITVSDFMEYFVSTQSQIVVEN